MYQFRHDRCRRREPFRQPAKVGYRRTAGEIAGGFLVDLLERADRVRHAGG
jgi:hypothetical protein